MGPYRKSAAATFAPRPAAPERLPPSPMTEPFQFTVTDAGPCRKRVRVVVPPARVVEEVEKSYRGLSEAARIPGFRPGRVPRAILEKRYGDLLAREVKESLVQEGFREALRANELSPLGAPDLDLDRVAFTPGKALEFEVALDVRPRIELPDWKGLAVERRTTAVSEAEVDEAFAALRKNHRRVTPDAEGGVAADGLALARVEFLLDGASLLAREAIRLSPQTPVHGADPGAFAGALQGRKKGESFEVEVEFRSGFEVPEAVGKRGKAKVTLTEVYRLGDPSDEELARALDFADAPALREDIGRRLQARKDEAENRRVEDEVLLHLTRGTDFELPERIVESETAESMRRFQARLEAEGVPPEEVAAGVAARAARSREETARAIKTWFVIEALARREKIFVTEEEIASEFEAIARRNRASPAEVRRYYEEGDLVGALRAELLESKVRRHLRERAGRSGDTPAPS